MDRLTRRGFLSAGALASAGAVLAACGSSGGTNSSAATSPTTARVGLPEPAEAPFDTVVVLMMENRSFDHLVGWLPGANGRQAGLSYTDTAGVSHPTWPLAPDWQGWAYADPQHTWQAVAQQYNNGACDGFLQTQPLGDQFPIGYYYADDLPVHAALAANFTSFDQYFSSMLGPTWPNRIYQHCAATDLNYTGLYPDPGHPDELPPPGVERPSNVTLAIWDRLAAAGLTGGYYYATEPMTGLFASRRYDAISHRYDQFLADAAAGTLPNVTFVDPDYGTIPEYTGTSNDLHPHGSVKVGDAFIGEVYDALRKSPQWDRMVFVINYDEHGGFYDHVAPPTVPDNNAQLYPQPAPQPDYTKLGFRVPAFVVSPFAAAKLETAGPYEHCSVLKMIEWRWGLDPMTERDRHAKNLAEALDFSLNREAPAIATPSVPATIARPA